MVSDSSPCAVHEHCMTWVRKHILHVIPPLMWSGQNLGTYSLKCPSKSAAKFDSADSSCMGDAPVVQQIAK